MPQARKRSPIKVSFDLEHDTEKTLKAGKRRYKDEDGHNIYLTGEEVTKLGSPDAVSVTVEAA